MSLALNTWDILPEATAATFVSEGRSMISFSIFFFSSSMFHCLI
jgi:hypothetical protein